MQVEIAGAMVDGGVECEPQVSRRADVDAPLDDDLLPSRGVHDMNPRGRLTCHWSPSKAPWPSWALLTHAQNRTRICAAVTIWTPSKMGAGWSSTGRRRHHNGRGVDPFPTQVDAPISPRSGKKWAKGVKGRVRRLAPGRRPPRAAAADARTRRIPGRHGAPR